MASPHLWHFALPYCKVIAEIGFYRLSPVFPCIDEEIPVRLQLPLFALSLVLALGASQAWAQIDDDLPAAPAPPAERPDAEISSEGLRKILEGLGYEPKGIKAENSSAWQIELEHANGDTRRHLIGFDPKASTVFIIGGGFAHAPDPKKATNAWFRKLLKQNHQLAPNYIFLNDFEVFGLTTVMGNVNITPARMKAKLKEHVQNFDERLTPLVKELPSMEKGEEDKGNGGGNSGSASAGSGNSGGNSGNATSGGVAR